MALSLKRRRDATAVTPDAMTLTEHLTELRRRILVCALAFVVTATVAFIVYPRSCTSCRSPTAGRPVRTTAGSTSPAPSTGCPCG